MYYETPMVLFHFEIHQSVLRHIKLVDEMETNRENPE